MASRNTLSALDGLRELSIAPGAVYLGPWADIDHEKFLIVAGVAEDRILVCSVLINSEINPYIQKRPRMLSCQVMLKGDDYDFLSHDSYANCAQPIRAKLESFLVDDMKYCGLLNDTDLDLVQQRIIASGMLTVTEINTFFGNK
ncbi:MAG: hypothetical protein IJT90_03720 [Bacteroidaceae bacterium]|nr:hypothetical protein [Bacteroidaceae bacterium]